MLRKQLPENSPELENYHIACYQRGQSENEKFWLRLGGRPDLKGLDVLDLGCGHGRLCLEMAMAGARKVIGIDTDAPVLDFAQRYLHSCYPEWRKVVSFECCQINTLPDMTFDVIVAKDVFEHVINLQGMLAEINRRLKPGGCLYSGFGPLYYSPTGYHERRHFGLPWGHLLIPKSLHLALENRGRACPFKSLYEADCLNELSFAEYVKTFNSSDLRTVLFRVNQSERKLLQIFNILRIILPLREYFTYNIYCIMKRSPEVVCAPDGRPR